MNNVIPQVIISGNAFRNMKKIATQSSNDETGGLVLGYIQSSSTSRFIYICKVSGPGPNALLKPESFQPDMSYFRKTIKENKSLQYLGEWHKHNGTISYSLQDVEQARKIMRDESLQEILCPICEITEEGSIFRMICHYMNDKTREFMPLSYRIAPDEELLAPKRIIIEQKIIENFICSEKEREVFGTDFYPEGAMHLFCNPLFANGKALLINGNVHRDIELPRDINTILVVRNDNVRGYWLGSRFQSVETQIISPEKDILQRNNALLESKVLKKRRIALIGMGSIGSVAVLDLAKSGVGAFSLFDPDKLAIANICRHACDLQELGMDKVSAVANRIRRIMPDAQVDAHAVNTNDDPEKTLELCQDADLLLVSTDTENSRRLANWLAHELNIPVIFAGVLERAKGGRVWRVVPGYTACYECYPGQDHGPSSSVAYSQEISPRDLSIQPGLSNDIAFITHLAVRYAIDTLLAFDNDYAPLPYHMVFWFNHAVEKWQSESLTLYKVDKLSANPDCSCCG